MTQPLPPHILLTLPPEIGPAPRPPTTLLPVLELLDRAVTRRLRELATLTKGGTGKQQRARPPGVQAQLAMMRGLDLAMGSGRGRSMEALLRDLLGPAALGVQRPRILGLLADELASWCPEVCASLEEPERRLLLCYAADCRVWEQGLNATIGTGFADPDWDMASASSVLPSVPEAVLARALTNAGLTVQAQVGVSKFGGPRKGGWYTAYWLDYAHRDSAFLLRVDIELDGAAHRTSERKQRDRVRNALLQHRGWYVVRFDARLLKQELMFTRAVQNVMVEIVQRHRRAILLARTDLVGLGEGLQGDPDAVRVLLDETGRRAQAAVTRAKQQYQTELIMQELLRMI